MCNLTDLQRRDLRELLCDEIEDYCREYAQDWAVYPEASNACKFMATTEDEWPYVNRYKLMVELLGEWPVGYRGEGGWEKMEL